MTTRINMRNISRKNLSIEIRPRNDGSVTFLGEPPKNALLENGGVKFTLATKKIDRAGIRIPYNIGKGDLYINTINDRQIGKNLIGRHETFSNYNNLISPYSLAQLGIGSINLNHVYNPENDKFVDFAVILVNNTKEPIVLNGVVLNEDYLPPYNGNNGGSMSDGSMSDSSMSDSSMSDSSMSDSSMSDSSMSDGSMSDGSMSGGDSYNIPGIFGEYIKPGNAYINMTPLKHSIDFQDPDFFNPTFVQENGEWGIVLGERNHRAGTYVYWKFQLPDDHVPQTKIMFYLPYSYTDKFSNITNGQAVYIMTRNSIEDPWSNYFDSSTLAGDICSQIVGKGGIIVASKTTFEKDFTLNITGNGPNWVTRDIPSNVDQIDKFSDIVGSMEGTKYQPSTNLIGQQYTIEIGGQTYIGIDKDLIDIQIGVTKPDPETESMVTVPGMHYSDSTLELKPNDPVYVAEEIVPEEYIFINLARNTLSEDGLGFTKDNLNNFIVTSSGINNANVWYNADGSEYTPPIVVLPPPIILS